MQQKSLPYFIGTHIGGFIWNLKKTPISKFEKNQDFSLRYWGFFFDDFEKKPNIGPNEYYNDFLFYEFAANIAFFLQEKNISLRDFLTDRKNI